MGKSTLLKCIMGLLPVRRGSISFSGKATQKLAAFEVARLGIGYVPEGRQIFPTLNVEENLLATAANRHGVSPAFDLQRIYAFFLGCMNVAAIWEINCQVASSKC